MRQISILGCGWLGLPLAEALLKNSFLVKGSTTSKEKLSTLQKIGIQPFQIVLSENGLIGDMTSFLEKSTVLIIDVPPKLRGGEKENFVSKIKNVLPFIEKSAIENILFISSTSVYGEENGIVTEETEANPKTESGKQLLETEKLLHSNSNFKTTILRFGGLIGENRHPARFLAGKKNLESPHSPINLIHQEDCIGIILKIIEKNSWDKIFNAVAPYHPTRKEYYTQKAIELNLEVPEFRTETAVYGKTISSTTIEKELEYCFVKLQL